MNATVERIVHYDQHEKRRQDRPHHPYPGEQAHQEASSQRSRIHEFSTVVNG